MKTAISTVGFSPIHINRKIKACEGLTDAALKEFGFIHSESGGFWFYRTSLPFMSWLPFICAIRDSDHMVDLFVSAPVLDSGDLYTRGYTFGDQKYRIHYQEELSDPTLPTTLFHRLTRLYGDVEDVIDKLQDARIIEGHVRGEWI